MIQVKLRNLSKCAYEICLFPDDDARAGLLKKIIVVIGGWLLPETTMRLRNALGGA